MKDITIIEPCNFVDYPTGGQLTFVRNLLQSFNGELSLVGVSTENEKIGSWTQKEINGKQYRYFPFMKGARKKKKPLIPRRLVAYFQFLKYRKKIINGANQVFVIQAPEILLPLSKRLKDRKICFIFPGIKNPLMFSRYFYARLIANFFDTMFLSAVSKARWILAAADDKAIKELKSRGNRLADKEIIQFPTRIDETIFKKEENNTYRQEYGISPKTKVVVTCGRLGYYKGWRLMIDAYVQFQKKYTDSLFYFIGNGEDYEKINQYIKTVNLEKNIILLGFHKSPVIAKYLNLADLFIMGSYTEGWSTTLLEAACMGVPSVVTDFSSSREIIKNEINGYVVENRNPDKFAQRMIQALTLDRSILPEKRMENFAIKTLKSDLLGIINSH